MDAHHPIAAFARPRRSQVVGALVVGLTGFVFLLCLGCQELPRTYSTRASVSEVLFRDSFQSERLDPHWTVKGGDVRVEAGVLKLQNLRNRPLWLDVELPNDVRIEFDAWPQSEEGDVKVELCGDGHSVSTSTNYTASGYVVIFGGWNNQLSAIVRGNEHGSDKVTTRDVRAQPGRRYHLTITREDRTIHWDLDGQPALSFDDPSPLRGPGHNHFAFSGWEAPVHFDNLVIEAL